MGDGLRHRHRPIIGSQARPMQPDLGSPCRRTDADLRGLHLFEARKKQQALVEDYINRRWLGEPNQSLIRTCVCWLWQQVHRAPDGTLISRPAVPSTHLREGSDNAVLQGRVDDSAMHPPRQTISQAPTANYADMVRVAMKGCRIALTRPSCETMHRLDQLTVHDCCAVW